MGGWLVLSAQSGLRGESGGCFGAAGGRGVGACGRGVAAGVADVFTVSVSGDVAFGSAKDFEEPDDADADGTYELTVQVSDGVNEFTTDLLVTLDNVTELEDIEGPSSVTFAENSWSRVAFTASSQQDRAIG